MLNTFKRFLRHLFTERPLRHHWLTLALYAALTAVSLDNLVLHFATAIPESWDYAIYYWNLWWVKYALFTLHRDPMFTNYVLYPNTINLSLHTLNLALGLLTLPLQYILGAGVLVAGLLHAASNTSVMHKVTRRRRFMATSPSRIRLKIKGMPIGIQRIVWGAYRLSWMIMIIT